MLLIYVEPAVGCRAPSVRSLLVESYMLSGLCCLLSFSSLEEDLLLIMTHYIEKDQMLRNARALNRPSSAKRTLAKPQVVAFVWFFSVVPCEKGELWF